MELEYIRTEGVNNLQILIPFHLVIIPLLI